MSYDPASAFKLSLSDSHFRSRSKSIGLVDESPSSAPAAAGGPAQQQQQQSQQQQQQQQGATRRIAVRAPPPVPETHAPVLVDAPPMGAHRRRRNVINVAAAQTPPMGSPTMDKRRKSSFARFVSSLMHSTPASPSSSPLPPVPSPPLECELALQRRAAAAHRARRGPPMLRSKFPTVVRSLERHMGRTLSAIAYAQALLGVPPCAALLPGSQSPPRSLLESPLGARNPLMSSSPALTASSSSPGAEEQSASASASASASSTSTGSVRASPTRKWKQDSAKMGRYDSRKPDIEILKREVAVEQQFDLAASTATTPGASSLRAKGKASSLRADKPRSLTLSLKRQSGTSKTTFGVELEDLMNEGGQILYIPKIIAQFATRLERFGREEGANVVRLFDVKQPWIQAASKACRVEFDSKGRADLSELGDPRVVAALFITFFEALPTPLIPPALQPHFLACAEGADDAIYATNVLLPAVWALPECHRAVLQHILSALRNAFVSNPLADREQSLQVIPNVLGPVFLRGEKSNTNSPEECALVLRAFLMHYEDVFLNKGDILYEVAPDGVHAFVKQASLRMLLEKVADEHYTEEEFPYHFLLTYQYYLTHQDVQTILFEQYDLVVRSIASQPASWKKRKKERIARTICRWVRVRGEELVSEAPEVVKQICLRFPQNSVTEDKTTTEFFAGLERTELTLEQIGDVVDDMSTQILRECGHKQLAEQITALHSRLLRAIPLSEFIKKKKGFKEDLAPHLQALVNACNKLTGWAVSELVTTETTQSIEKFIKIGQDCMKLKNYNAAFAINAALQHSAVSRLAAWEKVKKKHMSQLEELKELFSLEFNYRKYRIALGAAGLPAIPCLIMITHDIFALEENMPTLVTDRRSVPLINLEKMRNIGSMLADIRRYQGVPYSSLTVNPAIARAIMSVRVLPDEILYRRTRTKTQG
eukprot:m51a1_g2137 putative domain-containing protein (940) ;mRNA; r:1719647-1723475